MPGNLYFYVNFCIIEGQGVENTTGTIKPLLRDIEWFWFYSFTVCDGFSGFVDDPNSCCFSPLRNHKEGEELSEIDRLLLERFGHFYTKENGEYKEYINPREYLYRTYDKPYGRGYYHNQAQNHLTLSTRRIGKSVSHSNGLVIYDLVFNGARTLTDFLEKKTQTTTVVGSADYSRSGEFLEHGFNSYEHLRTNVGSYKRGKVKISGCLWRPIDGYGKGYRDKGGVVTNKVAIKGGDGYDGPGSKIPHVSYKDNDNAAVGHGARKILKEEVGLMPNYTEAYGEDEPVLVKDYKIGWSASIGTGGNMKTIKGVKDCFYNPKAYKTLTYKNLYTNDDSEIALFIPVYYKNNQFRDKNGNLNVERSFKFELEERLKAKKESYQVYHRHIISFPFEPKEMFMSDTTNPYPIAKIDDRLAQLDRNKTWERKAKIGDIDYIDALKTQAVFRENKNRSFIKEFGVEDKDGFDTKCGFIIYELPVAHKPGIRSTTPLYIVVTDPVQKEEGGTSLVSCAVFKLFDPLGGDDDIQFNIVAEWVGRMNSQDENHEQAFKLAALYQCKILPELNLDAFKGFAVRTKRLFMLENRPYIALGEVTNSKKSLKGKFGFIVPSNKLAKRQYERNLNDLLLKDVREKTSAVISGDNNIPATYYKMVDECYSYRLLDELKSYRPDEGNYDLISAMYGVALWVIQQETQPIKKFNGDDRVSQGSELISYFNKPKVKRKKVGFNY